MSCLDTGGAYIHCINLKKKVSMSKFLQGTIILIIAGLITRVLGFVNRIVVARMIGDEGVGLYMMAVPTLVLVITLTQLGLPVAISKLVAEAEALGDRHKIKKILVVSLSITCTLSILFTLGLILFAPVVAKTFFTDSRTIYPLLAIIPVIPIIAVSSVIRGYFPRKAANEACRLFSNYRTSRAHYVNCRMYKSIFALWN